MSATRAALYRSYGPPEVLEIVEVEPPGIQADDRVLIRVHAASVNPYDYLHRRGYLPVRLFNGLRKPKEPRLGIDVAGTVEAVGKQVDKFKVGDRVFGSCLGAYADYVCPRQGVLCLMPKNATFQEAAAIPCAGLTALQALRDVGQVKPGQKVLIYGASGGIGHFAVQLAKVFGAEVTAVCSTANLGWVTALGATHVLDYTREDFAANGARYHLILDAVGKRTFFSCLRALTETGLYITEHPIYPRYHPVQLLISRWMGRKRARLHLTKPNSQDLEFLCGLVAEGRLRPVIEQVYPLEQVAAAHRHVESGHTKGKIVVAIKGE
ncbi:MAG TPA: NAD(P)-dependent alcohol dehydrogenase [Symbiobacteriaceae bacterium]|nr:NAD(P)-dependent alcohol dehydrogenase [Symbiobacteriaceae bacterium]